MATVTPFIEALGESATLKTRAQGARDATTQWPAITWSDSTISIIMQTGSTREVNMPAGRVSEVSATGYVGGDVTVVQFDRLVYHGETYEVRSVETTEHLLGDAVFKKLSLVRLTE